MRLKDKVVILIGAGQSPGEGMGNGRATALTFAREGAKVFAVDRDLASAEVTAKMARDAGGECVAFRADVTSEDDIISAVAAVKAHWGRIDVLYYNVGISLTGGDALPTEITIDAFDRIVAVNLRGAVLAGKHVVPIMREQGSGSIITVSSMAAYSTYPLVTYKATKAALITYTEQLAIQNAEFGIRCNVVVPGLIDTPMAVDTRVRAGNETREQIAARRDSQVPLRRKQGTAWDIANAALFLASDEADFISGVALRVDGAGYHKNGI